MAKVDESMIDTESEVFEICSESVTWLLKSWSQHHQIFAAGETSCTMTVKEPKLALKFFLKPTEKSFSDANGTQFFLYYSLCAEMVESFGGGVVDIKASITLPQQINPVVSRDGKLRLNGWKKGTSKVLIKDFLVANAWYMNGDMRVGKTRGSENQWLRIFESKYLIVTIDATLFQLSGIGNNTLLVSNRMDNQKENDEVNMMTQLKNMYEESDNYSDLKLETKDHITLSAHKFQLSARSPVFKMLIEAEVKKNGFDGTIKIPDVNAKPLIIILHWIYSGELHKSLGKFLEDVVDAAVKYKLVELLKILDKKVIEVCTVENMFHLFQLAKRIPLPSAIEDIAAFIKEHL